MQRVIKRDGREVKFDKSKIIEAISHANQEVIKSRQIGSRKISQLADIVEEKCAEFKRAIKVEDINDLIEDELIFRNYNDLVRAFIKYRHNKELVRKSNTTDDSIWFEKTATELKFFAVIRPVLSEYHLCFDILYHIPSYIVKRLKFIFI